MDYEVISAAERSDIIAKAIEAQNIFQCVHNVFSGAPESGICWRCQRNIYDPWLPGHYDTSIAGNSLISGCPYCHRTFVD